MLQPPAIKLKRDIMRGRKIQIVTIVMTLISLASVAQAGPYSEQGVNSYIDPNGDPTEPDRPNAILNPIFRGWASAVVSYEPTGQYIIPERGDPNKALGPSWTDSEGFDTVSLGDLTMEEIDMGAPPGRITLSFDDPIYNGGGYDFVVFENGFEVLDKCFCELGFVEVSSDGVYFARFPAVSLVPKPDNATQHQYYYFDISNVYNLAGKHPNLGGWMGTPFDLSEIADEPNVVSGLVDINNISYVRIVDIPGSGDFDDNAVKHTDPDSRPYYTNYDANHPIYDAWLTWGSGGFDLEAIGVLYPQQYAGDINLDGIVDYDDLPILAGAWLTRFGQDGWVARCDLAEPKDYIIDMLDYAVFAKQWLKAEQWRSQ